MDALTRLCGAVAALGAALIAIAVGAAAVPWLAVPLVLSGAGQLAVMVAAFRGWRWPLPAVLAPLAAPTALWLLALLASPEGAATLPLVPMLAESVLALAAAVALLVDRRIGADPARRTAEPRPLAALLSLAAVATVVAGVATPALAGTHAGSLAQPHGEHGLTLDVDEHGGH
ncbi:hypothetical protein [Agrococcus terreus]|uniref:Uncharacterized protein n=1 Tax=Agrococcus terreus TaxID=574649 RepID=A0ABQ2KIW7_9MICO|nr:hypothetical protein GCM10010968_12370 [Agrococcus terreus]